MIEMKAFTKEDWYGFAGATSFPDGTPPHLGELTVDGHPAVVVVDACGLQVQWSVEDTDYTYGHYADADDTDAADSRAMSMRALLAIKPAMTMRELAAIGLVGM